MEISYENQKKIAFTSNTIFPQGISLVTSDKKKKEKKRKIIKKRIQIDFTYNTNRPA